MKEACQKWMNKNLLIPTSKFWKYAQGAGFQIIKFKIYARFDREKSKN